jgi:hypothetical protein
MFWRLMSLAVVLLTTTGRATALSDHLLSPNFFASQGSIFNLRFRDALSWVQNPSLLAEADRIHLSAGTFLVHSSLDPKPAEKTPLGAAVLGLVVPGLRGTLGLAISMPLGQNVWVDTGSRQSSALFGLSRNSAFSLGLGWAFKWAESWALGVHVPILFRSNTVTDIYLVDEDPWSRARSGVMPYFGLHLGLKKSWAENSHASLSYREEQASKIEFSVKGEVDFATITLPLDAAGFSEILFEPRRIDLRIQHQVSSWIFGTFFRWSHWRSAPSLGLKIESEVPQVTTKPSMVNWQDQYEFSVAASRSLGLWTPVASYRFRSKAISDSDDYWDYNEHILGLGAHVEVFRQELWVSAALRLHKLVAGGELVSLLGTMDWVF